MQPPDPHQQPRPRRDEPDDAHELRDRLAAIMDASDDAIISTTLEGEIRSWNSGAERLFGYTAAEAIGKLNTMIIPAEQQAQERDILARISRGQRVEHLQAVRVAKSGRCIHVSLSVSPVRDPAGRIVGATKVARDVSESRLALQQRALLAAIVDTSDDVIISKSLDGTIRSWNAAAERLFGYTAQEAIGQNITLIIPPELRAEEKAILDRLRRGERIDHFETVRVSRDGHAVDVSVSVSPVRDADGRIVGASKVARDITERKNTEASLRRSLQELERFVAIASHDLQEPLRGISLLISFVLEEETALGETGRAKLGRARDLCARLTAMVNGLLEYARVGGMRQEQPCDLSELARRAADKLADSYDPREVTITVSPGLPTVRGDPVLLERVFANLISNAIRHNPGPDKRVEVGTEGPLVYVRDNGPGIDPRFHERVFTLFTRLASAGAGAGFGLGLALVKNIMESHNGRVWLDSSPGLGSTFYLRFATTPVPPPSSRATGASIFMSRAAPGM